MPAQRSYLAFKTSLKISKCNGFNENCQCKSQEVMLYLKCLPSGSLEKTMFHIFFHFLKHFQGNCKREQIFIKLSSHISSSRYISKSHNCSRGFRFRLSVCLNTNSLTSRCPRNNNIFIPFSVIIG